MPEGTTPAEGGRVEREPHKHAWEAGIVLDCLPPIHTYHCECGTSKTVFEDGRPPVVRNLRNVEFKFDERSVWTKDELIAQGRLKKTQ